MNIFESTTRWHVSSSLTWLACVVAWFSSSAISFAADPPASEWTIGFGKSDVTPREPVRLSGYSNRDKAFESIADKLSCRAMVLSKSQTVAESMVMVSVDSIAITAQMTGSISQRLEQKYGIPRNGLVICSTHSHAAPHIASGLNNLYQAALTSEESDALLRNTTWTIEQILATIDLAMNDRQPGKLHLSEDTASFAVNRRVLNNGVWSKFGIQADGPVDHRVRLLKATDMAGKLRGAVFMYACHCTTMGGDFNQVSGDWAGMASSILETEHPNATFLATIGCGADANPNPRTGYEDAKKHAAEMTTAVNRAIAKESSPLKIFPVGHFGYAGLAPELPTREHLDAMAKDAKAVNQRWSAAMSKTWNEMGRLPETYPAPIHTWQFGDDLTWVFLGGEVVVDYQLKLESLLPGKHVWVAAYTDDVFAYVASERMRAEGGYEVDFSMIYYLQPGRWATGTEELLVRRVREVLEENQSDDRPLNAKASLESIRVPSEFTVDLLASEPTIADPINIAFGHDGRIWIVEMADYPLGNESGGRIRWLLDSDGDGSFDKSEVFLDGLSYPTSVTPWRDGILVIAAPNVIFAKDSDGDGKADTQESLLVGLKEGNPQHRASGFEVGLDGWLHFGVGQGTQTLKSIRAQKDFAVGGCDVAWNPDTGEIRATSGETQFCRARDEFDRWFGNSNSKPLYQYVIEEKYVRRSSLGGSTQRQLLDPPVAPPVFPASRTIDRFNDLHAKNRFTSACGSIICRVPGLGKSMRGSALVCEPVHNLVARFQLERDGTSMIGKRFNEDDKLDWFASTDPWSRPVRAINAPDGTIWIVDMVRQVIEHPEWIPTSWQQRLDVRAGQNLGRIYRVRRRDYQPTVLPKVAVMTSTQLADLLGSDNGALRDIAQLQFSWRPNEEKHSQTSTIQSWMRSASDPAIRLQAFATLVSCELASENDFRLAIQDLDPRVVRYAVEMSENAIKQFPVLLEVIASRVDDLLGPEVDLQLVLTLGLIGDRSTNQVLGNIIARQIHDPWIIRSLPVVHEVLLPATVESLLAAIDTVELFSPNQWGEIEASLQRLLKRASKDLKQQWLERFLVRKTGEPLASLSSAQLLLLCGLADSVKAEKGVSKNSLVGMIDLTSIFDMACKTLLDSGGDIKHKSRLMNLLGRGLGDMEIELDLVRTLLAPNQPPEIQEQAMSVIRRIDDPRAADLLIGSWSSLTTDARRTACATLLQRRTSIEKLLTALENNSIKVRDLDAATVQQLRSKGDRSLMARCEKILGKPATQDRTRLVSDYLGKLIPVSDNSSGNALFVQHCAACHLSTPSKPLVGPPLENLKQWTTEQWVTAILDPNRALEPKYHQYMILTTDGQVFAGVIENRSSTSILIAVGDGSRREIALADIESMKDVGVSLMPEGLESAMSPEQLSSLLAFVRVLGN